MCLYWKYSKELGHSTLSWFTKCIPSHAHLVVLQYFLKNNFDCILRSIGNTSIVCVLWVKYVNLSVGAVQRFVFISHDCQGTLALLWPQELSLNPGLCLSPELELSVPAPKDLQLQPGPCPAALSLLQRKEEVMHTYISLQQAGY